MSPLNTLRNNNVVITSKRRYFDVITSKGRRFGVMTTSLLRNVFAGINLLWPEQNGRRFADSGLNAIFIIENAIISIVFLKASSHYLNKCWPRCITPYDVIMLWWVGVFFCDVMYLQHYNDVIMGAMASQITSLTVVYSGADQRKHQSSASLAGNSPVTGESPHKWPVTRKMFPLDDVIMKKPPAFIWYYCSQTICLWSIKQVLLTSRPELRQSLPVI